MTHANAFPMPFLISAQRAALYIDHGLKKKKKYIIFPWPMYMISLFARLCPSFIMRRVIQRLPAKDAT
jgi:short-subunit dehydrogenase